MTTINYVFSTLSGTSVFYGYSLTKFSNDVVIVNQAEQTVTFSDVTLQPNPTASGSATDAITLNGTLSYSIP
jgi:hypothetical protein